MEQHRILSVPDLMMRQEQHRRHFWRQESSRERISGRLSREMAARQDAVKRIAMGTQAFSVFMDSRELAAQCEEMVNVYLHGEDDPEVNDYRAV